MNPISDLSAPFNARYAGRCTLMTCERRSVIEPGDVVQYVVDELMHMVCARRVAREQTAPLCEKCWCYHAGLCA